MSMMEKAMKACFWGRQGVAWWSLEERLNFEYSLKKKEVDALRENKKSLNWNQFEDTAKIKMCFVAFMACLYHGFILLQYSKQNFKSTIHNFRINKTYVCIPNLNDAGQYVAEKIFLWWGGHEISYSRPPSKFKRTFCRKCSWLDRLQQSLSFNVSKWSTEALLTCCRMHPKRLEVL